MVLEPSPTYRFQLQSRLPLDHSPDDDDLTLSVKEYLLNCMAENKAETTVCSYCERLMAFVKAMNQMGAHNIEAITANYVRMYLITLQQRKLKSTTVNVHYRALRTFFNRLEQEQRINQNPFKYIKPPKVTQTLPKPFTADHIQRFFKLCSGTNLLDIRNRAMIMLFWDTGVRLNEMSKIKLEDINDEATAIVVLGKGAKERMLALGQEAQKALLLYIRMRKDQCPELWISDDGRPMTRAGICVTIKKLCDRAGIQGVKKGPHTFRHTFATQSYMNGAREFEVQRLLGHSTQTMTKRYVNLADGLLLNQRRFSPADNFFRKHK